MKKLSQTSLAIQGNHKSITTWAKLHNFHISAVNDVIHKRGYYIPMRVPNRPTKAYRILQQLIEEGYTKMLEADGWDCSKIDNKKFRPPVKRETDFEKICWSICELGDEFTCNVFLSPVPDAGPVAILFMMEHNGRATAIACECLNANYLSYTFCVESSDVITIWAN